MIRILVRTDDAGMAANVGGHVEVKYKTFDVELPELEQFLREDRGIYSSTHVIGVELLPLPQTPLAG